MRWITYILSIHFRRALLHWKWRVKKNPTVVWKDTPNLRSADRWISNFNIFSLLCSLESTSHFFHYFFNETKNISWTAWQFMFGWIFFGTTHGIANDEMIKTKIHQFGSCTGGKSDFFLLSYVNDNTVPRLSATVYDLICIVEIRFFCHCETLSFSLSLTHTCSFAH